LQPASAIADQRCLLERISGNGDPNPTHSKRYSRDRALVRMAAAHATASSAQVVDMMFNAGGGSSLYESGRLARCWRDAHAMTQHLGLSAANFERAAASCSE
jgi:alkylation response protein AidB-like acyl-CoA dehydrogenase